MASLKFCPQSLGYDALNLWVMPKIGEEISAKILALGGKFDSKLLKGSAPVVGYTISNFLAFTGLAESIKARKNAKDPVDIKIADLDIATNSIFIAADVPAIVTKTMSALGREVGVIGEFTGPAGDAISISVIIMSQFVEVGFEVEKLAEHIKLTDQEKYELYWSFFFGIGTPRRIEADKKANEIYEQYISRVVDQYSHYDRITILLPSIVVINDETFVRTITAPSRPKTSLSFKEKRGRFVDVELLISHVSSGISRIIPHTVGDYKVICGPLDKDIVEKIIEKERKKEGPVTFTREVKEWSLREYPKNVTSCDGVVTYQKDTSSPSKTLLYLSTFSARILADRGYDLVIHFTGQIILSSLKDSSVHGVHEKHGTTHRYYFADQLLHCSVHNRMTNFFYITEKDNFFCSLQRSYNGQRNTVVTQGNFTDFENIHSVIGNNKTNYITISHANYVDGKGGGDVITTNNPAIIRGYFGDSIHGNGLVLLPMNFSDIGRITQANNLTNIYNGGEDFISIDSQALVITADGLFVTPVPIRVGNETNIATNLHVIKRVDSNITLDDELNNLREIDNSNFNITKQLLCPNSTSIISNAGNNIFYPDKEHHNFYWEASSDMRHLYLINQRNVNITIAQANGMLDFSQLNSTLDDVSFIENEQGEMKFNKDGLHVTLLPDYKNVTVTFDGKEYYKLQSGKLERDYCSHPFKIDGSFSVNGTDLLNHYNCFTVDSNKILFLKLKDSLLLVSGKNALSISAYYPSIHKDWDLSIKLNDRIIEPEKFRERSDSPSAFRYYRPDERGLQIYHNQPTNKHQIGLMDLRNNSVSDWNMRIDEDLILSLKKRPIIQVKNWNISQLARKMMFAFNDTAVFNVKCIVSNCNPEDIIKEFEEEKRKVSVGEKTAQRKRRHHHGDHDRHYSSHKPLAIDLSNQPEVATSSASQKSSWINVFANTIVDAVKGISQFIFSPFKPAIGTERSQPPKAITTQGTDVNSTLLLLDVFIRRFTGQKYISTANQPTISLPEARYHASDIINGFEKVLNETAVKSGISITSLNFDPIKLQSYIVGQLINGKFSEISKTLYLSAKQACPEFRQTKKFLSCLEPCVEEFLYPFSRVV